jgi:hypothetical protein
VYRKLTTLPGNNKGGSFRDFRVSMVRTGAWAPVSVYADPDDGTGLKDAVTALLREFGLATVVEEPPVHGSWFQRFWARSREIAESESVRERLAKAEEAIQLEHLGKRRAEIDKAKAESAAALLDAIKGAGQRRCSHRVSYSDQDPPRRRCLDRRRDGGFRLGE